MMHAHKNIKLKISDVRMRLWNLHEYTKYTEL